MKDILSAVFNEKTYKSALPYILIIIGGTCFTISVFMEFENAKWQGLFHGIGLSVLAGGIFALLLKSLQFTGVFKEELTKVIFEPRYIANRNDLPEYWDKVSMELFKNKFPKISQKLLKDVKEIYFPTKAPIYYEDVEHYFEILSVDASGMATIKRTTTLTIITKEKNGQCTYDFSNNMPFENSENEVEYISDILKVNSQPVAAADITKKTEVKNNVVINQLSVNLKGRERYQIERIEEKKTNIIFDNHFAFRSNKILNKLRVEFHFPDHIDIVFKKSGTLDEFKPERETVNIRRYYCNGIIYPEQGYIFIYKIKKPNS
jgi:hypothetical protein